MLTEAQEIEFRTELATARETLSDVLAKAAMRRASESTATTPTHYRCGADRCYGRMHTVVADLSRCDLCGREVRGADRQMILVPASPGLDAPVQWTDAERTEIAAARRRIDAIQSRFLAARV